ncbi:hypothetical protein CZP2022_214 [Vibrio phage C-ZP2022]|nr:hypothetical protein CZP2022_214 [Vibrio phage C-ZP2022]
MSYNSCIALCVQRIMADIDKNILARAFKPQSQWSAYDTYNLEYYIEQKVVRDYLMVDLNLVSGQSETIPVHDLPYQQINNAHVFKIPTSRTHGRRITAVHSLEMDNDDIGMAQGGLSAIVGEASMGPRGTGTARAELVAPNTIAVYEWSLGWRTFVRCQLAHDDNLGNINPRFQRSIAQLAVLAAKHLINVELAGSVGDGDGWGGAPSSYMRQIIDEYAGAKDIYEEELKKIPAKAIMNDRKTYNRILRLGITR